MAFHLLSFEETKQRVLEYVEMKARFGDMRRSISKMKEGSTKLAQAQAQLNKLAVAQHELNSRLLTDLHTLWEHRHDIVSGQVLLQTFFRGKAGCTEVGRD